ncbi:hypothetical protein MTR67_004029 [Solanum verrucosum]|uniref:Uncharacterized protein n=1 Tax=Solanum verrucosum TaxID=315347 RepID=A0AAF0TA68_SOLVR|nr:hypothetical protein MTR67_004029 [Solanum verrucosum]
MTTKVFNGANVFMSRNLVPPEQFDALHDALKLNGAQVLLCCDPSRNAPTDYHVISSPQHEKFGDLQAKGCNLIAKARGFPSGSSSSHWACLVQVLSAYFPVPKNRGHYPSRGLLVALQWMGSKFWHLVLRWMKRLGTGPEWDHRTGTNRYRTGTGRFDRVVDRYRDEPDRNYRDRGSVPSRPTIYRDRTGTDRNGPERNGTG